MTIFSVELPAEMADRSEDVPVNAQSVLVPTVTPPVEA